ncbi:hypothetical protein Tco_1368079 [Tanacetum coccineum]
MSSSPHSTITSSAFDMQNAFSTMNIYTSASSGSTSFNSSEDSRDEMDNNLDTSSKEDSSSLLKSVKANALASKVLNIEGKILPRRYTTYQEPLKDAGSSKDFKIKEMRNEVSVDGAAAALPIEAVETVNARFTNTLYGYFIGDRLTFPLVENYVNNTWAKYGLKRI